MEAAGRSRQTRVPLSSKIAPRPLQTAVSVQRPGLLATTSLTMYVQQAREEWRQVNCEESRSKGNSRDAENPERARSSQHGEPGTDRLVVPPRHHARSTKKRAWD